MIDTYFFFGDSITSGENNNFISYVEYLKLNGNIVNNGVSGTTFGRYSLYPVNNFCLESLLEGITPQEADNYAIVISYGPNDCSSACLNYVNIKNVLIDFIRCVDMIRQTFKHCKLVFLGISSEYSILLQIALKQKEYLKELYFKHINSEFDFDNFIYEWVNNYYKVIKLASEICDETHMMMDSNFDIINDMDEDGLHPNDVGYFKIANKIISEL